MRCVLKSKSPCVLVACAVVVVAACAPDRLPGEGTGTAYSESATSGAELLAEAAGSDIALAMVGGHVITLEEFDLRLASLSETARLAFERPERRPAFFETLVLMEMVARDAEASGWAGSAYERVLVDGTLLGWWLQQQWPDSLIPAMYDEAEVAAMYDDLRPALSLPERRSSRVVVWDNEADAQAAIDRLNAWVEAGISATVAFEWIAMQQIDNAGRENPGYIPSSPRPEPLDGETDAVVEALFSLETRGDVAGPIRTGRGWEVVQLFGVVPPLEPSLDAMDSWLRSELVRQRRLGIDQANLATLRDAVEAPVDEAVLQALVSARRGGDPVLPQARRFSGEGLAGLDRIGIGDRPLAEFDATAYESRRELIAPLPADLPVEGSGEGSGDPVAPETL